MTHRTKDIPGLQNHQDDPCGETDEQPDYTGHPDKKIRPELDNLALDDLENSGEEDDWREDAA